jgi:peptidyl-prolyl cis-trans isomerase C
MNIKKLLLLVALAFSMGSVVAQSGATLITVNGAKITAGQLDQWVSVAVSEGAKDSNELRQGILNDLILREAVAQDVKKSGLLSKGNNAFKVKLAEQNALMDIWFAQYFAANPITEAEVRSAYDKQVELSKDPKNSKEYLVGQIVASNELEGADLIKQINGGTSFADLAKAKSLDKTSGQQGGVIGWVLPSQLIPPVNEVVPNLSKGRVAQTPIKTTNGWHVVMVEDVRPFTLPTFDQAKNTIAQSLVQQRRQEAVNALMKTISISQAK